MTPRTVEQSVCLPGTIWTIGHSNRTFAELLELLRGEQVQAIADVRRFPGSRRLPQFSQEALRAELNLADIEYRWLPALGGRRRPLPDSPNTAWRNTSFRGYADHMSTEEFQNGFEELLQLAAALRTAVLCSEAVWWRCHRSLIADALRVRGVRVLHILSTERTVEHPYTSAARIIDGQLNYGASPASG